MLSNQITDLVHGEPISRVKLKHIFYQADRRRRYTWEKTMKGNLKTKRHSLI